MWASMGIITQVVGVVAPASSSSPRQSGIVQIWAVAAHEQDSEEHQQHRNSGTPCLRRDHGSQNPLTIRKAWHSIPQQINPARLLPYSCS